MSKTPTLWESYPDWSPDGKEILFTYKWGLWAIDVETGQRRGISPKPRVINGMPEFQDYKARWSPDGMKILFLSVEMGRNFEIYMCDSDGENRVNLTNFTPDGSKIMFVRNVGGRTGLFSLDINSKKIKEINIPNPKLSIWMPDISPDGRRVVFLGKESPGLQPWRIYVVDLFGGDLRRLDPSGRREERSPRWSLVPIGMGVSPSGKLLTLWGMLKIGFRNPR